MIDDVQMANHAAEILKVVAHPTRLRIVAALVERDHCVGDLARRLKVQQPIVSQQLKLLRLKGLVDVTRAKGLATYRLTEPHLENIIRCMQSCMLARRG